MSVRVPAANRPKVTSEDFACRVQTFAEKHDWTRFSLKRRKIGENPNNGTPFSLDLPPEEFAYCSLGYINEVFQEMTKEGYNRTSLMNVKRGLVRRLAAAIRVGYAPTDHWAAESIIASFNDEHHQTKEAVVAKFRQVCEDLKARAAKKKVSA